VGRLSYSLTVAKDTVSPVAEPDQELPSIDSQEFVARRNRVCQLTLEMGLSGLIAFDTNDKLAGGNARYLAGDVYGPLPAPSYVVLGPLAQAVLVVMENRAGTVGNQARSMCGPDVGVVVGDGSDWASALSQALDQVGATRGTIGVEGLPPTAERLLGSVQSLRPDLSFVMTTSLLERVRRDKSALELQLCRRASSISHHVFQYLKEIVEPGLPHAVAVAEATLMATRAGAEELVVALGSGRPWIWSSATPVRSPGVFEAGEPVSCEVNVRYGGYFSQVARSWPLGPVSPERQRMIDAVHAAHDAMVRVLMPGAIPREVFGVGLAEIERRGFAYQGIRYGHGLGLTIGEGWDFADDPRDVDPNGSTLSPVGEGAYAVCHPFLFERADDGTVLFNALWGDPWIMASDGPEFPQ
jgi:Xaa-Pro aminopeptidase